MATPNGFPIWYELMTRDPMKVAPFYRDAVGWTIPAEGMTMPNGANYRWLEREDGGHEGGVLAFDPAMVEAGMQAMWATYFCVSDVDAKVEQATGMGAVVHMPATTIPGAGRMAMLADPAGAMFYLITPEPPAGQEEATSDVFAENSVGRCAWNELNTDQAPEQVDFYTSLFDWEVTGAMEMPGDHIYKFLGCGGSAIGAICSMKPEGVPSHWLPYFRVADIDAAIKAVAAHGGKMVMGPHEVPNGDTIIVAFDPEGAIVGFTARRG
jgi:hypothetical protein